MSDAGRMQRRHEEASRLFLEIRALPGPDRDAAIRRIDDSAVRAEVVGLLEHDVADGGDGVDLDASTGHVPASIGPYRVLRKLGRGGSGVVLLAEQDEPVRRQVAIKIVPHAMVDPVLAARFDLERTALERLEHPNVARLLDAGRTAEGLPYLVMEFVEGLPIDEFARIRGLSVADRVDLMLQVAAAVRHAHQRGVVHRDLTPANILVGEFDGRAVPRVLDFGIAKLLDAVGAGTGGGVAMTGGLPLGTLASMAPEQTGQGVIDTRTDVYAMGSILYELLAGVGPIPVAGDPVAAMHRIRHEDPAPFRPAPGLGMPRGLRQDLECVLRRAMAKSPDRRYETAAAFAEDLRRALARRPIMAHPPGPSYRIARFVERHRVGIGVTMLLLVALGVSLAGVERARRAVDRQRLDALAYAQAQFEIHRFLGEDLLGGASPLGGGPDLTALELLDRAAARVDDRFRGRPLAAAAIHRALGTAYVGLGAFEPAGFHLEQARALHAVHASEADPDAVRTELAFGTLLASRQDLDAAETHLRRVIPLARLTLGPGDPALYGGINDLGTVLETLGRGSEALPLLEEAVAGRRRVLGDRDPLVLVSLSNLAQCHDALGDADRSLALLLEALRIVDAMPGEVRMLQIGVCNNIGATLQDLGRHDEAGPYLRRADGIADAWLGPDSPVSLSIRANLAGLEARLGDPDRAIELFDRVIQVRTRLVGALAYDTMTARYGRANALLLARRPAEAIDPLRGLQADVTAGLGGEHWLLGQVLLALATAYRDLDRLPEALEAGRDAAGLLERTLGADHPRSRSAVALLEGVAARIRETES